MGSDAYTIPGLTRDLIGSAFVDFWRDGQLEATSAEAAGCSIRVKTIL